MPLVIELPSLTGSPKERIVCLNDARHGQCRLRHQIPQHPTFLFSGPRARRLFCDQFFAVRERHMRQVAERST